MDLDFDNGWNPSGYDSEVKTEEIVFGPVKPEEENIVHEGVIDNIGRDTCYWCGKPTVKKPLFSTWFDYCEGCKK